MAVSHQGTYVQLPKLGLAQILNADGASRKTLVTAGADGNKIVGISASSTDSLDRLIQFWVLRGGVFFLLNTVSLLANSGFVGTSPPINVFTNWGSLPVDNDGQAYLYLESGDVLSVASTTSVVSLKELDIFAVHGTFS